MKQVEVTGNERFFEDNEVIVSKTDLKGRMTYCNKVFLDIAGYQEKDCLGQPHSMIRHPHMPRAVFKLLWETIESGGEIFAYVVNRAINGDHYWVLAHVTPSFDEAGNILGYHSNRRVPDRRIVENTIVPLYKQLLDKEAEFNNAKEGMNASAGMLGDILTQHNLEYDQFIAQL